MVQFWDAALKRVMPDNQAVSLAISLLTVFLSVYFLADLLMPMFVSIVVAYLLEGVVSHAGRLGLPRWLGVGLVFAVFLAALLFLLIYLMPLVSQQAVELAQQIPEIINRAQNGILRLPEKYPKFISQNKLQLLMNTLQKELLPYGQSIIALSAKSVVGLVTVLTYLLLVPMMVFFFLKDKELFINWFLRFIPKGQHLTVQVWMEVDTQIGNYVRGKFTEVLILWLLSFATFSLLGLNYAMLLSVLMGLSVIVPYIGATLVTFPVVFVAYFQWGFVGDGFMYALIAYSVVQALEPVYDLLTNMF